MLHTLDEEIEQLERMVEADQVEHMINIMVEKPLATIAVSPELTSEPRPIPRAEFEQSKDRVSLHKVHISPCGTPLGVVRLGLADTDVGRARDLAR